MRIKSLGKLTPDSGTWKWRTVEGDSGMYYTFADGTGIHFYSDAETHFKVATCEKFKVCKTVSGTRKKLNRMFANKEADPSPENPWRF